jgi:DNA invertase Pin-like site-specific DNA recombinase
MKRYAAAYLRRSHATKDSPGDASEEAQTAAVQSMCGEQVVVFKDWGISGRRDDRPEYQRLKAEIRAGRVASVCAYSLSRLGRSTVELLSFVKLCREQDVTVRTKVESFDTATPSGRAMLGVFAVFAELEAELAKERGDAARAAIRAKHEAAGVPLLAARPVYGYTHVRQPDGTFLRVPDMERPAKPVLDAYRRAGSVTGACKLLRQENVPSPDGQTGWAAKSVRRVIEAHEPGLLPRWTATGKRRAVTPKAALAGLVRCHCGRLMTANRNAGTYFCSGGRDQGVAVHGPYTPREGRLIAQLRPIAAQLNPHLIPVYADGSADEREQLEARRQRVADALLNGVIDVARAKRETVAIEARLVKLTEQERSVAQLRVSEPIDWEAPVEELNAELRSIWSAIQLDRDLNVERVEWAIPSRFYDRGAAEAHEREVEEAAR